VTVTAQSADTTAVNLEVCPNETITYLGQTLQAGGYAEVVLINAAGCDSLIQISVTGFPPAVWASESDASCWNGPTGSLTLTIQQGEGPFLFSLDGASWQSGSVFEDLASGAYPVFISDGNDCSYETSIAIGEIPPIEVNIEVGAWDCVKGFATTRAILSGGLGALVWPDGSQGLSWQAVSPGDYNLVVQGPCETISRSFQVKPAIDAIPNPLYFPNIFSPNNDGINETFRGFPAEGVEVLSYEFLVFDRWGNHIFESRNIENGWNGLFDGQELGIGVYVYYVRATLRSCGQNRNFFREGDVTLIR
jgi:gliding motility-associated-like protein